MIEVKSERQSDDPEAVNMSFRSSSMESDGINEPEPLPEDPVEIAKK